MSNKKLTRAWVLFYFAKDSLITLYGCQSNEPKVEGVKGRVSKRGRLERVGSVFIPFGNLI